MLVVYPSEFLNDWETINETSLSEKEESSHNLNMEDIKDSYCNHAIRICKDFEIKNLGESRDLYLKSGTSLFAEIFQNFRKMCS